MHLARCGELCRVLRDGDELSEFFQPVEDHRNLKSRVGVWCLACWEDHNKTLAIWRHVEAPVELD